MLDHVRTGSHENGQESLRTSWSHGETCGSFETWENPHRKSQKVIASFRTSRSSLDFYFTSEPDSTSQTHHRTVSETCRSLWRTKSSARIFYKSLLAPPKPYSTFQNSMKSSGTSWNPMELHGSIPNPLEPKRIFLKSFEPCRTKKDPQKPCGASSNTVEPHRTVKNLTDPFRTLWNLLDRCLT